MTEYDHHYPWQIFIQTKNIIILYQLFKIIYWNILLTIMIICLDSVNCTILCRTTVFSLYPQLFMLDICLQPNIGNKRYVEYILNNTHFLSMKFSGKFPPFQGESILFIPWRLKWKWNIGILWIKQDIWKYSMQISEFGLSNKLFNLVILIEKESRLGYFIQLFS